MRRKSKGPKDYKNLELQPNVINIATVNNQYNPSSHELEGGDGEEQPEGSPERSTRVVRDAKIFSLQDSVDQSPDLQD